jgi:hypothetical protein
VRVDENLSPTEFIFPVLFHSTVKFAHEMPPAYHTSLPEYMHVVGREIIQSEFHLYPNTPFSILPFPHVAVRSFILFDYSHDFPLVSCYNFTSFA